MMYFVDEQRRIELRPTSTHPMAGYVSCQRLFAVSARVHSYIWW